MARRQYGFRIVKMGCLIDHIMLSPDAYLNTPPGDLKNDTHTYPVKKTP